MNKEQQAALAKIQEQSQKTLEAVAASQDVFISKRWGRTVFHEATGWSEIKTCQHCILREDKEECRAARCSPEFRTDGKDGYFTVQNFPTPPTK